MQLPNDGNLIDPGMQTRLVEVVFPTQANHHGTWFGGAALGQLAKAAFVAATRRSAGEVVLAATDRIDFHRPVKVGQVIEIAARVVRVGRSSMTVEVAATAETSATGTRTLVITGQFEMVAIDRLGRPRAIETKKVRPPREDATT